MSLPIIGRFSLKNKSPRYIGGAKIQVKYSTGSAYSLSNTSRFILYGQSLLISPRELGVPDGSTVVLRVRSRQFFADDAEESFTFDSESAMVAMYTLTRDALTLDDTQIPDWVNWSNNILHKVPDRTYFYPNNLSELRAILSRAAAARAAVRVSGQRHSQPALVACDRRSESEPAPLTFFVDLACYADLGANGKQTMVLNADDTVTVNAGVREDDLVVFLTNNDKILPTVTAGGFFSTGGMTSVDVHGSTVAEPIFSETATAFNFVLPDGTLDTIDETTPSVGDFCPIQFARVNVGALGIVTSVTLRVVDRPFANSLLPDTEQLHLPDKQTFVCEIDRLLQANQRLEVFLNPYDGEALALMWNLVHVTSGPPNELANVPTACELADDNEYGAPYEEHALEHIVQTIAQKVQRLTDTGLASLMVNKALAEIENMFNIAVNDYSDLWLTKAARTMFMSYFIELPDLSETGLGIVWDGLNAVQKRLEQKQDFLLVAPLEFRFVRGGSAVLAGTYQEGPQKKTFINLDMIAFTDDVTSNEYPPELLQFFSDIEQEWVRMGGRPHNGKMFGFFDPTTPSSQSTGAFNSNFMKELVKKRRTRIAAFESFRKSRDPNGMFKNEYVTKLLSFACS